MSKCQIIIELGPNAGKKCGEVNARCRHSCLKECICGFTTNYNQNMNRHKKRCMMIKQQKSNESKSETESVPTKKKVVFSKKAQPAPTTATQLTPEMLKLAETVNKLAEKVDTLSSKPSYNININNNYNIAVMNPNFYNELEGKIGNPDAMNLLVHAATENDPIPLLKYLYFNGNKRDEYPIASRNGRYRYLNTEGQVVESGEDHMNQMLSTRIQKAMSYATGTLIQEMKKKNVDSLYDFYDLGKIQENICNFPFDYIGAKLINLTENPAHPFFMDDVNVLCLES